jgi:hypothetical protein
LFPGADAHISGRIEETSAALHVGMPPTQNIEHVCLEMHYINVESRIHGPYSWTIFMDPVHEALLSLFGAILSSGCKFIGLVAESAFWTCPRETFLLHGSLHPAPICLNF